MMKDFKILEASAHMDERGGHIKFSGNTPEKIHINGFQVIETFMTLNNRGTLRGMHYQVNPPQPKLITCLTGKALVNVIKIDDGEASLVYNGTLTGGDNQMLYIPESHALGYLSLEDETRILYHAGSDYSPIGDTGINPLDEELPINWDTTEKIDIILSARDKELPTLEELRRTTK